MLDYRVCALSDLGKTVRAFRPTHVISLIDPDMAAPQMPSHLAIAHSVLRLNDVDRTSEDSELKGDPCQAHADALVVLGSGLQPNARAVFHCVAGRRRSPAAAMICDLSMRLAQGRTADDQLIADVHADLISKCPRADPNRALLTLADGLLGFGQKLVHFNPPRYLTLDPDHLL